MKIGVALSGCDIGGIGALDVLNWLEAEGIVPHMLSASGIASVPALLWKTTGSTYRREKYLQDFIDNWLEIDLDAAVAELSAHLSHAAMDAARGICVNALSITDGKAVCFTNDFFFETETLCTFPLCEPYEALSSTVGPADGLGNFSYCGLRLCDYCLGFGIPFQALRLAGCDKILSFAFVPPVAQSPYHVSFRKLIQQTAPGADFHLTIPTVPEKGPDFATPVLESCRTDLFRAIAFGG